MTGAMLTQLLYAFIMLSVLLLIGTILRAKLVFFQKVFLPASVIGGFIGLLAGPIVWAGGGVQFPAEWLITWGALPGVLIVPVVASVPLGLKLGTGKAAGRTSANVIKMLCIGLIVYFVQVLIGLSAQAVFSNAYGLYPTFGYELAKGYAGGHGTAGVVGSFLYSIGEPYWEVAQGVTVATATFGIVGGMILGIIFINIMARKGQTAVLQKPGEIPEDLAKGIQLDPAKQKSAGLDTTINSSIESLSFHLSVILLACGIAYLLMNWVQANNIPIITQVPVWTYAIAVMFGVNYAIYKMGISSLIDNKTKSRITGLLTDYAVVAAIASMPVRAVITFIVPILYMVVLGFVLSAIVLVLLTKYFVPEYYVERIVGVWGFSTGVFITGIMLLKICDPEYKSPVLNDMSIAFSFNSMIVFILMPIIFNLMITASLMTTTITVLGMTAASCIVLFISNRAAAKGR